MAKEIETVLRTNPTALEATYVQRVSNLQRPGSAVRMIVVKALAASWILVHTDRTTPFAYDDLLQESPELAHDILSAVGEFSTI